MLGRKTGQRAPLRLILLLVLGLLAAASLVAIQIRDTALRVVSHEWERSIEVEESTGDRWLVTRMEHARGLSLDPPPHWPAVAITRRGSCDGCQREGRREESYVVRFTDPVSERGYGCAFPEAKWHTFTLGSRWQARFEPNTGAVDCASLEPADR